MCMEQVGSLWMNFHENRHFSILEKKNCSKIQVPLKM